MTILISLGLTFVVMGLVQWWFDYRIDGLLIIAIYLVLYAIVHRLRRTPPDPAHADEPDPDYSHLPTSGPIGRFGQKGLLVPWLLTNTLSVFNPFQARQVFAQIAGNSALEKREKRTGDDGRGHRTQILYSLPFKGEWLLYNGGMTPKTSHSWEVLGQRFALDFVKADDGYRRHTGRGTRAEEYYCFGEEILAAADGQVVAIENTIRQAPLLGWGICDFMARSFIGNYVFIQHAEGEYGLYAHLIEGSVCVRPGDTVTRGQLLGRCGHTGHSSEPHLHFHLQDSADLFEGMGLPVRLGPIVVDGTLMEEALLTAGNRVSRPEH